MEAVAIVLVAVIRKRIAVFCAADGCDCDPGLFLYGDVHLPREALRRGKFVIEELSRPYCRAHRLPPPAGLAEVEIRYLSQSQPVLGRNIGQVPQQVA